MNPDEEDVLEEQAEEVEEEEDPDMPPDEEEEQVSEEEQPPEGEEEEDSGSSEEERPSQPTTNTPRRVGRPRKEDTIERPKLSNKEAAALFKQYDDRKVLVTELNEHLTTAKSEVAQAAFEIYEKLGPGPFKWKGKTIKVFKSKNSDSAVVRVISDEAREIG